MIGLIGVNHQTAGVDERSKFSLTGAEANMLVEDWISCGFFSGAVILSTCNRVEIYYNAETESPEFTERRIIDSFLQNLELSSRYGQYLMTKRDEDVYRHLFRLTSGLESLVVGETQILGQVKEAYRMASLSGHCPGTLSRLFHKSFEVAKRLRNDYLISTVPLSAGSAAVDCLLGQKATPTEVLILGAGIMADTIYDHLLYRGLRNIVVYNRTRERAERFAQTHPQASIIYESDLKPALQRADAIIVATSAPSPIIYPEDLSNNVQGQVIIDLAVPRNVHPDVAQLEGVSLITIDQLEELGVQMNAETVGEVDELIEEYVLSHKQWVNGAEMREVIGTIHRATQLLLEREISLLPNGFTEEEQRLISRYDEHLKTTYTTAITTALREISEDGKKRQYSLVMQQLFSNIINKYQ